MLGPDRTSRRLGGALLLLGYRGLPAADAPAALRALAGVGLAVSGGLISSDLADPAGVLHELHASLAGPLIWTVWGARPDPEAAAALRKENVRFALGDPVVEEDLRFVLEETHRHDDHDKLRSASRVPTSLRARIVTKTGERVAVTCNLSTTGAYLATPRPTLRGGKVELEIAVPSFPIRCEAEVLWNNVPGNLRKPNTPIGMGVRFCTLSPAAVSALSDYLTTRAASYRL